MKTIINLIATLPDMLASFTRTINNWVQSDGALIALFNEFMEQFNQWSNEWLRTEMYETMTSLLSGIIGAFDFLFNIIVGFIVMIYVLFEKNKFRGQAKKFCMRFQKIEKLMVFYWISFVNVIKCSEDSLQEK